MTNSQKTPGCRWWSGWLFWCVIGIMSAQPQYNPLSVELARAISRDLFELNAQPFVKPLVEITNATSNARFFSTAYVGDRRWYVRFGIQTMLGFVRGDQKTYAPQLPHDSALNILPYLQLTPEIAVRDTVGLLSHLLRYILHQGLYVDSTIVVPERAPTIMGYDRVNLVIPRAYLQQKVQEFYPLVRQFYPDFDTTLVEEVIRTMPTEFPLPTGGDINTIVAAVPQLEIGGLWGTELLLRFVPPIEFDTAVGKFAFWGVAVKHQISRYFRLPLDIAVQGAYQGTSLQNTVGVTNAKLRANAEIWNLSVQASRRWGKWQLFTALALEHLNITGTYTYVLPRSLQAQLKLIRWIDQNGDGIPQDDEWVPDPPDYPGDTRPQSTAISAKDTGVKWIAGVAIDLHPVQLALDLNVGKFTLFTFGLSYQFQQQ